MSVSSERGSASRSSSRGRSAAGGSSRSRSGSSGSRSGSSGSSRARTAGSSRRPRASAGARANGSGAKRQPARKSESRESRAARKSESRQSHNNHGGRGTITNIGISVLSASIGVAGGVLLGRTLQRNRKVLGIPMPNKIDLAGVSQQIGEAGRQFGKLAGEVRTVRQKAEQVGRILT